jgi:hypothetical protein
MSPKTVSEAHPFGSSAVNSDHQDELCHQLISESLVTAGNFPTTINRALNRQGLSKLT